MSLFKAVHLLNKYLIPETIFLKTLQSPLKSILKTELYSPRVFDIKTSNQFPSIFVPFRKFLNEKLLCQMLMRVVLEV